MSGPFTESIDPLALAARGRRIEGTVSFLDMPRLQPLVGNPGGEAVFELHFFVAEGGIPTVQGVVESGIKLECQRCMEEMDLPITIKIHLGVTQTREQAERLPAQFDSLPFTGEELSIASIVEDELILALPTVAMHNNEDCSERVKFLAAENDAGEEPQDSSRKNPFAALAQLKEELSADEKKTDEE